MIWHWNRSFASCIRVFVCACVCVLHEIHTPNNMQNNHVKTICERFKGNRTLDWWEKCQMFNTIWRSLIDVIHCLQLVTLCFFLFVRSGKPSISTTCMQMKRQRWRDCFFYVVAVAVAVVYWQYYYFVDVISTHKKWASDNNDVVMVPSGWLTTAHLWNSQILFNHLFKDIDWSEFFFSKEAFSSDSCYSFVHFSFLEFGSSVCFFVSAKLYIWRKFQIAIFRWVFH